MQSTSELTDILSALRLRKGISIKELSQKLGVSQAAVSQWIHGTRRPRLQRLLQILTHLDASPQETEHILTVSGYNKNGDPKAKAVPVPTTGLQQLERKATRIAALYSEMEKEIDDLQALARQEIVTQSLSSGISSVKADDPVLAAAIEFEEELATKVKSIDQKPEVVLEEAEQKMPKVVPSRGAGQEPIEGLMDINVASLLPSFLQEVRTRAELAGADPPRYQVSVQLQAWLRMNDMQDHTPPRIEPEEIHGTEQVLHRAISLVKESLVRPEPPHEILITFLREQDGFELPPGMEGLKGEWLEVLRDAIKRGIRITQLCKLQEGHSNVQTLLKDIFALLGTRGAYVPFYFPQKYWHILPAYDLLIIPEIGALQFFGSGQCIDTALLWPTGDDLNALHAQFSYLRRRCVPIFNAYPARSPQFLDAVERAEEQDGDLYTVKSGLSVKFEPIELLEERVRPIIEKGGPKAKQFTDLIDSRKRRQAALFEQLRRGFRVRHICPESAIRDFPIYGLYSKDDWAVAFGGHEVMPRQVDRRIQAVVDLLEAYPKKFELALLDEKNDQGIFATSWKVKVGHAVFLESFPLRDTEVDIEITEPILVKAFQEYFDTLWDRVPIKGKNKSKVIKRLSEFIEKITKDRADAG
jgi:transcriptional regulator with XRE-family HTH domain